MKNIMNERIEKMEIFKTNVTNLENADYIVKTLLEKNPQCEINFDLEDCDNILRIKGFQFQKENIIIHLKNLGYECQELQ